MNEEQVNCFVNLIFDRLNLWIYDYGKEEALVYFVQYLTLFQKGYQANDALDITKKIMYLLIQERPDFIALWFDPNINRLFNFSEETRDREIKLPTLVHKAVFRDMMFVANGNYETTWENLDNLFLIWNVTGEDDPREFFDKNRE
ncbi:MAG: hypothetical protein F6K35_26985 [Okeania sp. SIO2H7]|nr:hypothetical protein [Okeania sp. SIO2H7]